METIKGDGVSIDLGLDVKLQSPSSDICRKINTGTTRLYSFNNVRLWKLNNTAWP